MLEKIKKIFKPENMMFRMAALNCGLLLLVTVVITGTGNVIYQNSIEESSYANTMEIQNQVLKALDLISSLFLIMWQPWALRRNFRNI